MFEPLAVALDAAATATAKSLKHANRAIRRRPSNGSLRPGPDTPLWNELATECAQYLNHYGDKARLGRILGVSRQRIHQLLVARNACADAERTLQLMVWLAAVKGGRPPA